MSEHTTFTYSYLDSAPFGYSFAEKDCYLDKSSNPFSISSTTVIRAYLKTGDMTNSEGFFRCTSHFSAGILCVLQGKMRLYSGKRTAVWAF